MKLFKEYFKTRLYEKDWKSPLDYSRMGRNPADAWSHPGGATPSVDEPTDTYETDPVEAGTNQARALVAAYGREVNTSGTDAAITTVLAHWDKISYDDARNFTSIRTHVIKALQDTRDSNNSPHSEWAAAILAIPGFSGDDSSSTTVAK